MTTVATTNRLSGPLVIAGAVVGLGVLIAGGIVWRSRWMYKECLKTWPSDRSKKVVEFYRLTREDFCVSGYTLSSYLSLEESVAKEIRASNAYKAKTDFGSGPSEKDEYLEGELKRRMREIVKPEK